MKILFVIKTVDYIDPMGVMLLSAIAKQKGHTTHVYVLQGRKLIEDIRAMSPDIVAFASTKTGEHRYYLEANTIEYCNEGEPCKKSDPCAQAEEDRA